MKRDGYPAGWQFPEVDMHETRRSQSAFRAELERSAQARDRRAAWLLVAIVATVLAVIVSAWWCFGNWDALTRPGESVRPSPGLVRGVRL